MTPSLFWSVLLKKTAIRVEGKRAMNKFVVKYGNEGLFPYIPLSVSFSLSFCIAANW